jgi:hypothetical protein
MASSIEEKSTRAAQFNGSNFAVWKFSIFLKLRGLAPIVEGLRLRPIHVEQEIDKWVRDDTHAMRYIFETCNEEQQQNLLTCETSHDMWLSITSQHQQGTAERRQYLNQSFLNYKFKSEHSVRSHVKSIKLLAKNYRDAGGIIDYAQICNKVLTSLPPSYDHFRTSWKCMTDADKTLIALMTKLCIQEERLNLRTGGQKSSDDKAFFGEISAPQSTSIHAPSQDRGRGNFRRFRGGRNRSRGRGRPIEGRNSRFANSNGSSRKRGRCFNCGRSAHWADDCWDEPYDEPYNLDWKPKEASSATVDLSWRKEKPAKEDTAKVASHHITSTTEFLLDSGATRNMCHQRHLFSHFKEILPGTKWINGIGQDRVEVLGIGNVSITPIINGDTRPFTLRDVLYAPQIGVNLVSVAALTNDESHVHFYESVAFITRQGILIMTAKRVEEALYQLNLALSTDVAMLVRSSFKISLRDWHERFAHQHSELIVKMADSKAVIGLNLPLRDREPLGKCHDCIVAKMTRKVFPHSTSQQTRIEALIISDVCGPMQVDSIGGARYYVCCQDAFSNYRSIYFVKHKSEASDCCRAFIASVHAQTGNLVAIFRTDG